MTFLRDSLDLWFCSELPPHGISTCAAFAANLLLNIGLSIPLKMWCTNKSDSPQGWSKKGKLVPDVTGSGESRQRKDLFRQRDRDDGPKFGKAYPEPELGHQEKIVSLSGIFSFGQCFLHLKRGVSLKLHNDLLTFKIKKKGIITDLVISIV